MGRVGFALLAALGVVAVSLFTFGTGQTGAGQNEESPNQVSPNQIAQNQVAPGQIAQNQTAQNQPADDSVPQTKETANTAGPASDPQQTQDGSRQDESTQDGATQVKPGQDRPRSLTDPLTEEEMEPIATESYVPPEKIVRDAFAPPPGARQLSQRAVWIDRDKQRVYVDGYVTMREGLLEMFACPIGTKEHESIVATLAKSSEVHTALLAVGAKSGTPVSYDPKYVPATGQRIRLWVCYHDEKGKYQVVDARRWVLKNGTTDEQLESDWVFAGSSFFKDPENGQEYYRANSGDMICVSNFSTAMLDIPINSSSDADSLMFIPYTDRIPKRGTPVRLVFVPIPIKSDQPPAKPKADPSKPPSEEVLPKKPVSGK